MTNEGELIPPTPEEEHDANSRGKSDRSIAKWIVPIIPMVEDFLRQKKGGREVFIAEIQQLGIAVDKKTGAPLDYNAIDVQIANVGHFMRLRLQKDAADAAAKEEARLEEETARVRKAERAKLRAKFGLPPEE